MKSKNQTLLQTHPNQIPIHAQKIHINFPFWNSYPSVRKLRFDGYKALNEVRNTRLNFSHGLYPLNRHGLTLSHVGRGFKLRNHPDFFKYPSICILSKVKATLLVQKDWRNCMDLIQNFITIFFEQFFCLTNTHTAHCEDGQFSQEIQTFFSQVVRMVKRIVIPFLLLQIITHFYIDPIRALLSLLLLLFSSKPHPSSIHFWKEHRELELLEEQTGLDKLSARIRLAMSQVEVDDYLFFCVATISYPTESHFILGVLGDWFPIHVNKTRDPFSPSFRWNDEPKVMDSADEVIGMGDTLGSKLKQMSKSIASMFHARKSTLHEDF